MPHTRPSPASDILALTANDIQDKVVLITGGAKGVGRMISEGFVSNCAKVYISSRDAKACAKACEELNALGKGRAEYITADLYKEEDVKKLAEELGRREGSACSFFSIFFSVYGSAMRTNGNVQNCISWSTTAAVTGASHTRPTPRPPGTAS